MRSPSSERGDRGEQLAAEFLSLQGYTLLQRNYRCRLGEIDIIAREGGTLCFIEVRSRQSDRYGDPIETVGWRKQQRLIRAARHYLMIQDPGPVEIRFDVVGVTYAPAVAIRLIRGAFEAPGAW